METQTDQTLTKIKNIIGGIAALLGVSAFSYYYFYLKTYEIALDNLYWVSTCFVFSCFSGLLFAEKRNEWVGSLYLMCFGFFGISFLFSIFDYIMLDKLRMSKIYLTLIISSILTIATYLFKWIKYILR